MYELYDVQHHYTVNPLMSTRIVFKSETNIDVQQKYIILYKLPDTPYEVFQNRPKKKDT